MDMKPKKDKIERMVTSIKIDPKIWKEAKKSAIDHDLELSQLVERALDRWINVESTKILNVRKR